MHIKIADNSNFFIEIFIKASAQTILCTLIMKNLQQQLKHENNIQKRRSIGQ